MLARAPPRDAAAHAIGPSGSGPKPANDPPSSGAKQKTSKRRLANPLLATFLRGLPPAPPTSIVGYSFYASIFSGGLRLLFGGGNTQNGEPLAWPPSTESRVQSTRSYLRGAATADDWLLPGRP